MTDVPAQGAAKPEDKNIKDDDPVHTAGGVAAGTLEQSEQLGQSCMQTFCCCFPFFQFEDQKAQEEKNRKKVLEGK